MSAAQGYVSDEQKLKNGLEVLRETCREALGIVAAACPLAELPFPACLTETSAQLSRYNITFNLIHKGHLPDVLDILGQELQTCCTALQSTLVGLSAGAARNEAFASWYARYVCVTNRLARDVFGWYENEIVPAAAAAGAAAASPTDERLPVAALADRAAATRLVAISALALGRREGAVAELDASVSDRARYDALFRT